MWTLLWLKMNIEDAFCFLFLNTQKINVVWFNYCLKINQMQARAHFCPCVISLKHLIPTVTLPLTFYSSFIYWNKSTRLLESECFLDSRVDCAAWGGPDPGSEKKPHDALKISDTATDEWIELVLTRPVASVKVAVGFTSVEMYINNA